MMATVDLPVLRREAAPGGPSEVSYQQIFPVTAGPLVNQPVYHR